MVDATRLDFPHDAMLERGPSMYVSELMHQQAFKTQRALQWIVELSPTNDDDSTTYPK